MSFYLDASVVVALLTEDVFTARAEQFLRKATPVLVMSDFAAAEFASVIARRVRVRGMTEAVARRIFSSFDTWMIRGTTRVETTSADVTEAERALRRLDLTLRTPDALNIAIAQRVDATLLTFDEKMAASARSLGLGVADI